MLHERPSAGATPLDLRRARARVGEMPGAKDRATSRKAQSSLRIAVGIITQRRPDMLRVLLASLSELHSMTSHDLIFVVVENDERKSVTEILERFADSGDWHVVYDIEPQLGIPSAQNKVVDLALGLDMDLLAFVDDDERVEPDWLLELTSAMQTREPDLAGGPLQLEATGDALTPMQRAVLLDGRRQLSERNATRAAASRDGWDGRLDAYTNNWCARLSKVRERGLRFDESLRDADGSDTVFSTAMREQGGRIGWVPSVIVHDRLPGRRLSPAYYYRRSRDQATVTAQRLNRKRFTSIRRAVERGLRGCLQVVSATWKGRPALAAAIYSFGNASGRLRAAFGMSSRHYSTRSKRDHIG
ncbi:glycosyltransferase [Pontivivens ytuae]|uniref:Glycosyltransferase family 2 protein n=1 Tax=Pontivivens ytuae TaxID=2789856 RepID=A0A7S9QBP3_9RHOB|nr:glycosyltransferase [Pontivivens ytuae]QPH52266.1 glycosyltransferase family 2 protein [Pontivivens ytuae]